MATWIKEPTPRERLDAEKDWRQEEEGVTEDEMVGWHHWLNGHEFEQTQGVGDAQENLARRSPWGRKESDTTWQLNDHSMNCTIPWLLGRGEGLEIEFITSGKWVQFSRSVVSDSLRPHESQHARPPCPSPTPRKWVNHSKLYNEITIKTLNYLGTNSLTHLEAMKIAAPELRTLPDLTLCSTSSASSFAFFIISFVENRNP